MTTLLLGPLLRHVDESRATIWVETDAPCLVQVRAGDQVAEGRTWRVAHHDYAILVVGGLQPGSSTAYEIRLDGALVWPQPDSAYPPSRIRTLAPGRRSACSSAPAASRARRAVTPQSTRMSSARMHCGWPARRTRSGRS